MTISQEVLFTIICPKLIITESIDSPSNAKIILEEIQVYEDFMSSIKQFLGTRFDDTIKDMNQNIINMKDAGVLIKNVISDADYLTRVSDQMVIELKHLMAELRTSVNNLISKLGNANRQNGVVQTITKLVNGFATQFAKLNTFDGWKKFLFSLGLYSFIKFAVLKFSEYSIDQLINFFTGGAPAELMAKMGEFTSMILSISSTTMVEFLGFFKSMAQISGILIGVLSYIRKKIDMGKNLNLQAVPDVKLQEEGGVGKIVKGVNTTKDVGPNEITKQAKKFGNTVNKNGVPPLLNKKITKNTTVNKLYNLGLAEKYSRLELAIMEGGHLIEPNPEQYSDDILRMPKYALVVNTPSDMDWYKVGQHYTSLGKEDPDEYGQEDSDMVIIPANKEELNNLKKLLTRLNMKYKDIGGTQEQPELHMEGILFDMDSISSQLDEGIKDKFRKAAMAGTVGLMGLGAYGTKQAYDKEYNTTPAITSQELAAKPVVEPDSKLAPKTSIVPAKRPDSKLAPKTSIRPRPRDTLTDSRYETYFANYAMNHGIVGTELAALLAQSAHETDLYSTMVEYGGKHDFKAYEGKNGNTKKGDGYKYRGRGYLHLTGKENYKNAGDFVGFDLVANPDLVLNPKIAAATSVWYWLNKVRPDITDFTDVKAVTAEVNGGDKGLTQRSAHFDKYMDLFQKSNKIEENLKKVNGKWALVSKTNPDKVLQYYHGKEGQKPSEKWVNKVERRVHAFESNENNTNLVDLSTARENSNLRHFHKDFMDKIRNGANEMQAVLDIVHDMGLLDDLPIGARIKLSKGGVYKVIGYTLKSAKTDVLPPREQEFRTQHNFGNPLFIKGETKYYSPMVYLEELTGEMAGSKGAFQLDKLVNFDTNAKRYTKFTGPTKIEENSLDSEIWYHGTPDITSIEHDGGFTTKYMNVEYITNFTKWEEMHKLLDSIDKNDYDQFNKITNEISKLKAYKKLPQPTFFTNVYSVAKTYANPHRAFDYQNATEKVIKTNINAGKILKINAHGQRFRGIAVEDVISGFTNSGISQDKIRAALEMFTLSIHDNRLSTNAIATIAQMFDFNTVDIFGVYDSYHGGTTKSTVRMVFDPSRITIIDDNE